MKLVQFNASGWLTLAKNIAFVLNVGYGRASRIIKNGDSRLSGKKLKEDCEVKDGEQISVYVTDDEYSAALNEIYRDENVIVVNKPSGIESAGELSLETRLSALLGTSVYACHRLDTNTKGVNIFALNIEARDELFDAFKQRRMSKEYVCEVFGKPETRAVLSDYLIKDAEKGKCRVVSGRQNGALPITTEYELKGQSRFYAANGKAVELDFENGDVYDGKGRGVSGKAELVTVSTLLVKPLTGRTHQIRAHLAYKGIPIVGDCKYGDFRLNKLVGRCEQSLTCVSLTGDFPYGSILFYLSGKKFSCQFV